MSGVRQLLRGVLVRDELVAVVPLVVGEHHGGTVSKRQILPRDVESLAAFVGVSSEYVR